MAGRIPQHFIDELLGRIDIVDIIDGYVPLKKTGDNYKACCPFHNEKTPSFTVSQSKQFYHCFGCGVSGSAISFLMEFDHLEFRPAIEQLASRAGLDIPLEAQEKTPHKKSEVDLFQLMTEATRFFQTQLRTHKDKDQAIDYLKSRGLDGNTAKKFAIGYAPSGWDNLINAFTQSPAITRSLMTTGLVTENDKGRRYDRFRDRIIFPIEDYRGRVIGFGGRSMDTKAEEHGPKYLNSPETPIFHKGSELYGLFLARAAIKSSGYVLIVEGYMDVISLNHHGVENSVATLGTATTLQHLQRLLRHSSNIIFSFDGDRAGREAAWKALNIMAPLMEDGIQASFLFLPEGEDPDTIIKNQGKEAFLQYVDQSMPLTDFLVQHLRNDCDLTRMDGRAKFTSLIKPIANQFPKGILKTLLIDQIAQIAQTPVRELLRAISPSERFTSGSRKPQRRNYRPPLRKPASIISPTRQLISNLLMSPQLVASIPVDFDQEVLASKGGEFVSQLIKTCREQPLATTAMILERYRGEKHFVTLEKLANHDHISVGEEDKPDETATARIERLVSHLRQEVSSQQANARYSELAAKGFGNLNQTEKEELKKLWPILQ